MINQLNSYKLKCIAYDGAGSCVLSKKVSLLEYIEGVAVEVEPCGDTWVSLAVNLAMITLIIKPI